MHGHDLVAWTLGDALSQLDTAHRMQYRFLRASRRQPLPCWEPPVDIVAGPHHMRVVVALPGVVLDGLEVTVEESALVVRGERPFAQGRLADEILCLEIPYGRFERRIALPFGIHNLTDLQLENGCLVLLLERLP
jgi:HSP20 family protein